MSNAIPRLADASRRDLELMLIGASLIKNSPKEVLECVSNDIVSSQTRRVLQSIKNSVSRGNRDSVVVDWLASRTVVFEPGDDALTAVVRSLENARDSEKILLKVKELNHIAGTSDVAAFKSKLSEILKELD